MRRILGVLIVLWTLSGCTRQAVKRDPAGPPAPAAGASRTPGAPANPAPVLTAAAPAPPKTGRGRAAPAADVDEGRAIAIAKRAVALDHGWVDRVSLTARREGDGWFVFVQRAPGPRGEGQPAAGQNSHRLLVIDKSGRVVNDVQAAGTPG